MRQYVEIDESNLRYYDVVDFEDGATFHTSLNTATITISGNFRKQYKLIPKEDVEHILKDGTIIQRMNMLGSILNENGTLTINHNGIPREFYKGIIHIDNFEYNLKIKTDDLINVPIVDSINSGFNFKKEDYMFDARARFRDQKKDLSLFGMMVYSDGSITFDYYNILDWSIL